MQMHKLEYEVISTALLDISLLTICDISILSNESKCTLPVLNPFTVLETKQ